MPYYLSNAKHCVKFRFESGVRFHGVDDLCLCSAERFSLMPLLSSRHPLHCRRVLLPDFLPMMSAAFLNFPDRVAEQPRYAGASYTSLYSWPNSITLCVDRAIHHPLWAIKRHSRQPGSLGWVKTEFTQCLFTDTIFVSCGGHSHCFLNTTAFSASLMVRGTLLFRYLLTLWLSSGH